MAQILQEQTCTYQSRGESFSPRYHLTRPQCPGCFVQGQNGLNLFMQDSFTGAWGNIIVQVLEKLLLYGFRHFITVIKTYQNEIITKISL